MFGNEYSEEQQPLTYFRGYPIHAATLFVVIHVAAFIALALGQAVGWNWFDPLIFTSRDVLKGGEVWRAVTYALVHPVSGGIWFAIEMYLLFQFGRDVEKFFGRRAFLRLYLCLLLLVPLVLAIAGMLSAPIPQEDVVRDGVAVDDQRMYFGSGILHFGIFVAFATLYPGASFFLGLTAKWVAIILLAIYTLQGLAYGDAWLLLALWTTTPFAIAFVKHERGELELPSFKFWRRKPRFQVVRGEAPPTPRPRLKDEESSMEEIDGLLDKISKSGLASLTSKERAKLEKARQTLMKREPGGR